MIKTILNNDILNKILEIEKNKDIGIFLKANPNATDKNIQDRKKCFRYSHCTDEEISRYWDDAKKCQMNCIKLKLKITLKDLKTAPKVNENI